MLVFPQLFYILQFWKSLSAAWSCCGSSSNSSFFLLLYQHTTTSLLFSMGYSPWLCTQLLYWVLFWLEPLFCGVYCVEFLLAFRGLYCCSHNLRYLCHYFGHLCCWFLLWMMSQLVGQWVNFAFCGSGVSMTSLFVLIGTGVLEEVFC